MARPSHSRALGIWANGLRVGRWVIPASGPMELSYDRSWVASDEARPLSLSLPLNLDGVPKVVEEEADLLTLEVRQFGATKTLVVTRFDRALHSSGRYWLRLPQEDFCQATGTPGSRKYESDGGPGLVEIGRVLQGSEARDKDLACLLRAELLFWMLAATDGHAKNLSIRLLAQGRYRLTPLYDVISGWPIAGPGANQIHPKKLKLAMAVRGARKHYRLDEIRRHHFNETARVCGLGKDMNEIIDEVVETTPTAIDQVGAGAQGISGALVRDNHEGAPRQRYPNGPCAACPDACFHSGDALSCARAPPPPSRSPSP